MRERRLVLVWVGGLVCLAAASGLSPTTASAGIGNPASSALLASDTPEPAPAPGGILVEVFLAPDHRGDIDAIKDAFGAVSVTRVRPQVFRLGNPPENIAIGKSVPAPVARLAIQLAVTYNRGVKFLLPEFRFFPDHIAIGSSAFDEKSQIPIRPDDLERLSNPSLTTEQFHELYRRLTGEDQRLPTYLH